jgi:hypothetical protein
MNYAQCVAETGVHCYQIWMFQGNAFQFGLGLILLAIGIKIAIALFDFVIGILPFF